MSMGENNQGNSRAGSPLAGRVGSGQGGPNRTVIWENLFCPTRSDSWESELLIPSDPTRFDPKIVGTSCPDGV